jgi:5-carboxymethyl-2-hydroxymuconate isomerase
MPHIIVEYSDNLALEVEKLASELHQTLCQQPTVIAAAVKTRIVPVQACIIGDNRKIGKMLHICLKLLPGRSDDLRKTMAQALFDAVGAIVKDPNISITVETVEIHAMSYIK